MKMYKNTNYESFEFEALISFYMSLVIFIFFLSKVNLVKSNARIIKIETRYFFREINENYIHYNHNHSYLCF